MTTYTIKITYNTGDSFNSYTTEDEVGMQWEDLNKAKQALRWITEHYKAYESDDYSHGPIGFDLSTISHKPWYYNKYWKDGMFVEKDDGSMQQICTFWCGYFESLIEAEVIAIAEQDDEMKVVF